MAFIFPVFLTWGPRHRSIRGPHLLTVYINNRENALIKESSLIRIYLKLETITQETCKNVLKPRPAKLEL